MLSRAWPILVLFSACSSGGPALDSTHLSDDFIYATYSGSCGQPRLSWTGSLDADTREAPLHLGYLNEHGHDCSREAALDLRPIRDVFLATHPDGGNIQLLVPEDTSNGSFRSVSYATPWTSECAPANRAILLTSKVAEEFAKVSGLDFTSCGREVENRRTRCCEGTTAGYDCLLDALAACSPARFGVVTGTVEGDPIFSDYFVVPADGACSLFVVTDQSEDHYLDPTAIPANTIQCGRASLRIAAPGECPSLVLDDCGL
jgi:hypothetical protein